MKYILLFLLALPLASQPWVETLNEAQQQNYFEIQKSFNNWVKDKDQKKKGQGIKQYRRWENYWKSRIYADGSFPKGNEFELLFKDNMKKGSKFQSANEWQFMGRTSSPGGYNGLGRVNVVKDDPSNSSIWYAGAASGGLWKSTNKGLTWTTNTDNTTNLSTIGISDIEIHPTNSNIMYLATGDRDGNSTYGVGVLKSTNGGISWNTTGLSYTVTNFRIINRILIDPSNTNKIFAAVNNGIYISTDAGASWNRTLTGNCKDIEFKPNNSSIVYTTTHSNPGTFYKSTDGGSNWTAITSGIPTTDIRRIEIAVTPASNDYVYLVACKSDNGLRGVYLSTDAGDNFSLLADSPNMLTHSADGSGSGGQGWYDLSIAVPNNDKNTILIGGVSTWKTTNLGVNWSLSNFWYDNGQVPDVHADQHDFHFTKDHILLVGNDGGVYSSTDKGTSWNWLSEGLGITQYYKISSSSQVLDHIIGGAQDNGTMIKKKNGTWIDVVGGDGMKCLFDPTDDDIIYASIQNGSIVKSTNNGTNWKKINDENNDNEYDDINEGGPWVTPFDLDPNNNNNIYVGMNQYLWKSTDGGKNFTKKTLGNSNAFEEVYVAKSNSNYVYACTESQFYRSTDKGETWALVSRPGSTNISDFNIQFNNENKIWATNSNWDGSSKVFFSSDGGNNWTNMSTGLPNIPVNCVLYEDDITNRVYIGTDIGIYYRDDNSSGWVEFSEGLPRVIVNDLEVNKDHGRLYAGSYGRGFWFRDLSVELDEPILASPTSGVNNLSFNSATFTWNAVNLANTYHIQISKSSNFLTIEYENANVSGTSHIITNLLANQQYFWRVRAKTGISLSDWSLVWNFKTKIGNTTLIAPENNSFNNLLSLNFRWNEIPGADSYKLQVSIDPTFNSIDFNLNSNDATELISGLSYFTKYYWRVAGTNSNGDGDWSEIWNFNTILANPSLLSPVRDSKNNLTNLTFNWESVTGAQTYDIQIDDNIDFSSLDKEVLGHGLIELDVTGLKNATRYFWRAKAHNTNSSSEWSNYWAFNTKLAENTLIFPPIDSNYVDLSVNLRWNKVEKGEESIVQVSQSPNFNTILTSNTLTDTTSNLSGLVYNKNYFWQVKSSGTFGENNWSAPFYFTTKLEPITLNTPANNAVDVSLNMNFSWTNSAGATKYSIQISDDINFTNKILEDFSNNNSYAYLVQKSKVYYWRVKAINDTNYSDWSSTFTFSTPIENPVLVSPANNSLIGDSTSLNLTWKSINGATEYSIFVSNSDQFANNLLTNNTTSSTFIRINNLEIDKDYFWKAKALVNGKETDFSEVWKFKIKRTPVPPGNVTLLLPNDASTKIDTLIVNFEWNASTNATSYKFELSKSNQFGAFVNENNNLASTTHSVSNLENNTQYFWRVLAKNSDGESSFSPIWSFTTLKREVSTSVNIADFNGESYRIYPNPAENILMIDALQEFKLDLVEIYDLKGHLMIDISPINEKLLKVNISSLSSGTYVIKLSKANDTKFLRFIKE